jgi:DHA1 family multidrug resistance protein-like MFS transporter
MAQFLHDRLSGSSLVSLVHFFFLLGFSGAGMLQPLLTLYRQLSQTEIGTLLFISSICSSIVRVPAGIASDRYGRRPSVLLAGGILISSAALYIVSQSFLQMVLPFSLWGIGVGIYWTSYNAMIADVTEVTTRFRAYSRIQIIGQIANLISPPFSGLLADVLGITFAYLFPIISFLILGIFSLWLPRRNTKQKDHNASRSLNVLKSPAMKSVVFFFTGLNVIHGLYVGIFWPARTIFFKDQFGLNYSEVGLLNSAFMLAQIIGLALSNKIAKRVKPKWTMTTATLASAVIVFLHSIIGSAFWLLPITMFHGLTIAFGFMSPIATTILMNSISESVRATVQGITGTVWRIGMAVGNLAMGTVWALWGLLAIPYIGAAILLGESILIFVQLPRDRTQSEP